MRRAGGPGAGDTDTDHRTDTSTDTDDRASGMETDMPSNPFARIAAALNGRTRTAASAQPSSGASELPKVARVDMSDPERARAAVLAVRDAEHRLIELGDSAPGEPDWDGGVASVDDLEGWADTLNDLADERAAANAAELATQQPVQDGTARRSEADGIEEQWRSLCQTEYHISLRDYGNDGHPANDLDTSVLATRANALAAALSLELGMSPADLRLHAGDAAYAHSRDPGTDADPDRFAFPGWARVRQSAEAGAEQLTPVNREPSPRSNELDESVALPWLHVREGDQLAGRGDAGLDAAPAQVSDSARWAPSDLDRWLADLSDDPMATDVEYRDTQADLAGLGLGLRAREDELVAAAEEAIAAFQARVAAGENPEVAHSRVSIAAPLPAGPDAQPRFGLVAAARATREQMYAAAAEWDRIHADTEDPAVREAARLRARAAALRFVSQDLPGRGGGTAQNVAIGRYREQLRDGLTPAEAAAAVPDQLRAEARAAVDSALEEIDRPAAQRAVTDSRSAVDQLALHRPLSMSAPLWFEVPEEVVEEEEIWLDEPVPGVPGQHLREALDRATRDQDEHAERRELDAGAAVVDSPPGADVNKAADRDRGERDWRRDLNADLATQWAPSDLDRWLSHLADDPSVTDAEYMGAQAAINSAVHDDAPEGWDFTGDLGEVAGTRESAEVDMDALYANEARDIAAGIWPPEPEPSPRDLTQAFIAALDHTRFERERRAAPGTSREQHQHYVVLSRTQVSGEQDQEVIDEADEIGDVDEVGDSPAPSERQRPPLGSPGFLGRALEELAREGENVDQDLDQDQALDALSEGGADQGAGRPESWRDPRATFGFTGPDATGDERRDGPVEVSEAVQRADQAVHDFRTRAPELAPDRSGMGHWQAEQARQAELGGSVDEDGSGLGRWA